MQTAPDAGSFPASSDTMTKKEYERLYREAYRRAGRITAETRRLLLSVFKEAGDLAAAQVARTEAGGLSDLTSAAWRQIDDQLRAGAQIIGETAEREIPLAISRAYTGFLDADARYIAEAAQQAGQLLITDAGIRNIGVGIDFRLLQAQATRIFQNGYTFSDSIWSTVTARARDGITDLPTSVAADYQFRIKNLILTGEAQGRDVVDIADDIQVYIDKGKDQVFNPGRYGRLEPGTAQYKLRISKRVDWRALRLIRSELNASLQEAGVLESLINPASPNLVDWIKNPGNPIDPDGSRNVSGLRCIDLMEFNPYKLEESPSYQHPNCSCRKVPVLMDQREFVADLKKWVPNTGNVRYLDDWYNQFYLPANT